MEARGQTVEAEETWQLSQDEEHLRLLSIFHYVLAAMIGLAACFPVIHLTVGIVLLLSTVGDGPEGINGFVGIFLVIMAGAFVLLGWGLAFCLFVAGRSLAARRRHLFCLIMAGVSCLLVPIGTVLGVFTIVVLMRPSVKEIFAAQRELEIGGGVGWAERRDGLAT